MTVKNIPGTSCRGSGPSWALDVAASCSNQLQVAQRQLLVRVCALVQLHVLLVVILPLLSTLACPQDGGPPLWLWWWRIPVHSLALDIQQGVVVHGGVPCEILWIWCECNRHVWSLFVQLMSLGPISTYILVGSNASVFWAFIIIIIIMYLLLDVFRGCLRQVVWVGAAAPWVFLTQNTYSVYSLFPKFLNDNVICTSRSRLQQPIAGSTRAGSG